MGLWNQQELCRACENGDVQKALELSVDSAKIEARDCRYDFPLLYHVVAGLFGYWIGVERTPFYHAAASTSGKKDLVEIFLALYVIDCRSGRGRKVRQYRRERWSIRDWLFRFCSWEPPHLPSWHACTAAAGSRSIKAVLEETKYSLSELVDICNRYEQSRELLRGSDVDKVWKLPKRPERRNSKPCLDLDGGEEEVFGGDFEPLDLCLRFGCCYFDYESTEGELSCLSLDSSMDWILCDNDDASEADSGTWELVLDFDTMDNSLSLDRAPYLAAAKRGKFAPSIETRAEKRIVRNRQKRIIQSIRTVQEQETYEGDGGDEVFDDFFLRNGVKGGRGGKPALMFKGHPKTPKRKRPRHRRTRSN